MIEYIILGEQSAYGLQQLVNNHIKAGWNPKGGISTLYVPNDIAHLININHPVTYYQAMTRLKEVE